MVTLDGQPLPEAQVTFQPQRGSPSTGVTDAAGRYELRYARGVKGALVGGHGVSISTYRAAKPDGDPPEPVQPERVPPRYNRATALTALIKPGRNQIDFVLESSGTIVQPKPGDY